MDLDFSLYPDLDESDWPRQPLTLEEQADYLHRLCSSWDFSVSARASEPLWTWYRLNDRRGENNGGKTRSHKSRTHW